jgi:hypothetical protein
MARKLTDTIQLKVRFDERLRRRIEKAAEQNKHTMNAEIVARLELSFQREDMREIVQKTVGEIIATVAVDVARDRAAIERIEQNLRQRKEEE